MFPKIWYAAQIFGRPPPSSKFGTPAQIYFVVPGKIALRTSLAAAARSLGSLRSNNVTVLGQCLSCFPLT